MPDVIDYISILLSKKYIPSSFAQRFGALRCGGILVQSSIELLLLNFVQKRWLNIFRF